jgi:hypothetical protein
MLSHARAEKPFVESGGSELMEALPTAGRERRGDGPLWLAPRVLGACALLVTGAVHLQQFIRFYSQIPTIGTLFALNFAGATGLAVALLAPLERLGARRANALLALTTIAGIALAATAFTFLLISEHTPLFGFKEPGYDPVAIAVSRVAEIAAVVCLGLFFAGRFWLKVPMRRW